MRKKKNGNAETEQTRKKSLSKSMQRLVIGVALVILVVASLFNGRVSNMLFSEMYDLSSEQVLTSIKAVTEIEGGFDEYTRAVIQTWESVPEDLRNNQDDPRYLEMFAQYENGEYGTKLSNNLLKLQNRNFFGDLYIAAIDRESCVILYLLDPDVDVHDRYSHFPVGVWEEMTPEQIDALIPEGEEFGHYIEPSEEYGMLRVNGTRILADDPPYVFLAMYDFPSIITRLSALSISLSYVGVLSLVILVIVLITRRRMKKRLVKPINSITAAAEQYVEKKKNGLEGAGSCFGNLDIHTGDELEELSDVMAEMEQDLGVYEQDLARAAADREHIQTELSVATNIQARMLPDAGNAFPDRSEFSIHATMDPAREVGGDFYDFFLIDKDRLGIVIADVSGKGIPAALFMMSSMIIINNLAMVGFSPKQVLKEANERICKRDVLDMFVSVWFGILDLKTGQVTAANAGHEYPVIGTGDGSFALMHDRHDLVVGAMEGVSYREYSFTLEKEGTLFLYTDGVAEATNAEEELYGTDRLVKALNEAGKQPPKEICKAVREDIDRFVKDAPQFDDITMLCVRYHGK